LIAWASQQADWATGFLDEVWWSRFALPRVQAWQSKGHPVRLVEQSWQKGDPDPKALACYGVLWQKGSPDDPDRSEIWLRFVTGRPVSAITIRFLEYCGKRLAAQGKRNWLLISRQCFLALQQDGTPVDSRAQSTSQADEQGGTYPAVLAPHTEPLAQPD
jgi:hypothetical protein